MTGNDIIRTAEKVAELYPRAFQNCHNEGPEENDFIILVGQACNRIDRNIGCNWSRAVVGDLARDGLTIRDPVSGKYVFADIVRGAGAPGQKIVFNPTGECPASGFVDPFMLKTKYNYSVPIDPPKDPVKPKRTWDDEVGKMVTREMDRLYKKAGRPGLDADCGGWLGRTLWDMIEGDENGKIYTFEESMRKHMRELEDALGLENEPR